MTYNNDYIGLTTIVSGDSPHPSNYFPQLWQNLRALIFYSS